MPQNAASDQGLHCLTIIQQYFEPAKENSVDQNQMLKNVTSDHDLHCCHLSNSFLKQVIDWTCSVLRQVW